MSVSLRFRIAHGRFCMFEEGFVIERQFGTSVNIATLIANWPICTRRHLMQRLNINLINIWIKNHVTNVVRAFMFYKYKCTRNWNHLDLKDMDTLI